MSIRLIALDIDGTLLDSDHHIRPRVRQAIEAAQERGIVVTLATGRRYRATAHIASDVGIKAPLVLNNGNLLFDPEPHPGRRLYHQPLALRTARLAISLMRDLSFSPALYCHTDDGPDVFYEKVPDDNTVNDWDESPWVERVPNLLAACSVAPDKILVQAERSRIMALQEKLERDLTGRWRTYITDGHRPEQAVLELFHGTCSKAGALRRLAAQLGIGRHEIMAIGDSYNDTEMLAWAGAGVAMGNAPPDVQRHARWRTRTNDEDGVAEAIERLALAGERPPLGTQL